MNSPVGLISFIRRAHCTINAFSFTQCEGLSAPCTISFSHVALAWFPIISFSIERFRNIIVFSPIQGAAMLVESFI
ncbi:hypothetical protein FKM82_021662 [Ascaphus truei]